MKAKIIISARPWNRPIREQIPSRRNFGSIRAAFSEAGKGELGISFAAMSRRASSRMQRAPLATATKLARLLANIFLHQILLEPNDETDRPTR